MRVGGCRAGRLVLLCGEQFPQNCGGCFPFLPHTVGTFKDLAQGSPTGIAHQHRFFLVARFAVLCFQRLYEPDCRDIGVGFFVQAPRTNAMRFGYSEVAGWLSSWLRFVESNSSSTVSSILSRCNAASNFGW